MTTLPAVSQHNPWTTLGAEVRYENNWIRVVENDVINPAGNPGIYGVVHFKGVAIGVLPIDAEGCVHLVGQYRYSLEAYSWEMPEGGGSPSVSPVEEAKRELREETGLLARQWRELLRIHTSNSICDEHGVIYIAWDMDQTESEPEDTEDLIIIRMPFARVVDLVLDGAITDAMTVAAVLKAQLLAERGQLPEDVAKLMLGR
ncbi:DNA mismatch repair protein MutT [Skermanella stibiiresistens SB22]|uniref:GDP-mannose pyrophosphatase n=1 Tax=Skermanella stibiiresistens SB22 TaxID=1385369 RepID=W9GUF2_9PROT|nr:DNA mismatch repair protein MutT [Skermanella stibiiresistens SB22]